ncbi:hypothetical protein Tco_1063441 [Tanacetum coccineum]
MATLKFADTHNMVAFLSKPTESDGFEQIAKTINGEEQLHALVDGKKIIITESSVISDLQLADEGDKAVHKELGDSLVGAATTASSLEAEQDSGNINKTQSKVTPNESSSQGPNSGGGPGCQETMWDTTAPTRFECEDASKQGRIDAIDADEEITLVSIYDVNVFAVSAVGDTIKTVDDITLAQALEEMKITKPKKKGVVIQELELVKPMNKKKLQIRLDEETTLNLQAEFDEEEKLAREKAEKEKEANITLIETWDDIQEKIDADHQLAERMQAQEQEELSIKEKATLFQQLLEKRRKHFAAKRAEEKRNKPPMLGLKAFLMLLVLLLLLLMLMLLNQS